MFIFNNTEDLDIASYNYQLYDEDQIDQSTPGIYQPIENAVVLSSGSNNASVFTVNVNGSYIDENGQEQKKHYFGRVRTLNTSGVYGDWTAIVRTDTETDLLDEQYIVSLTADRIKAGIIESAEIILGGANPQQTLIKSSTYNGTYNTFTEKWETGTAGWLIAGNGQAIFDATQIRGSLSASSINLNAHNYWLPSGGTATFKVGTASKYMIFDGTNITFTGDLSAAGGTFTGALSGGTIQIGSGESVFKADSNGIYLGNETFASAEFRVSPAGALTATNASITGTVTATSGSIGGWSLSSSQIIAGTVVTNDSYGKYITLDSSAELTAYRKDYNYGIGEYWTKIDLNDSRPGITVTGTANGSQSTSYITSTVVYAGLYQESATNFWVGAQYGYKGRGTHTYVGGDSDDSSTGTMRVVNAAGLYGQGTGGAATLDVLVNANGTLVAPSSSMRFKENINNLNIDYKKVLAIQPVTFFYKDSSEVPEGEERAIEYGVIAEQVEEAGVPELVNYKDGLPFSVPYSKMPVFLLEVCRKQEEAIEQLLTRVDELESRLV
jgi:hypothetical protein